MIREYVNELDGRRPDLRRTKRHEKVGAGVRCPRCNVLYRAELEFTSRFFKESKGDVDMYSWS